MYFNMPLFYLMYLNSYKTIAMEHLKTFIYITIGVSLTSIGLKGFLLPNSFLDGGVTGIALLFDISFDIPLEYSILVLTIPFLILAYFSISKIIAWKSIYSIALLSFMLSIEDFDMVTDDKLLICIFGGIFVGSGIGIAIRNGAVLDGTEILALWINQLIGVSVGNVIMIFNLFLFSFVAFYISVESAMYCMLVYIISSKVIDFVIKGFEEFIGVMVISNKTTEIKNQLYDEIGTGYTLYKNIEGYGKNGSQEDKQALQTIVNRIDLNKTHRIIQEIDPDAFIVDYDVNTVKGGIFRRFTLRLK